VKKTLWKYKSPDLWVFLLFRAGSEIVRF